MNGIRSDVSVCEVAFSRERNPNSKVNWSTPMFAKKISPKRGLAKRYRGCHQPDIGYRWNQSCLHHDRALKGGYKISFRSRCHVDSNELARNFGGGGHRAAAGAFIEGEFAEVQKRVLDATLAAFAKKG